MVKKPPAPPPAAPPAQIPGNPATRRPRKRGKRKSKAKANPRPPNDRGQGPKPFEPSREHRRLVELGAGLGLRQPTICQLVINPKTQKPIGRDLLRERFAEELGRGKAKTHFNVAKTIYDGAVGVPKLDAQGKQTGWITPPDKICAIFFAKTQMGWQEQQTQNLVIQQFENFILAIGGNVAALRAIRDSIPPPEN